MVLYNKKKKNPKEFSQETNDLLFSSLLTLSGDYCIQDLWSLDYELGEVSKQLMLVWVKRKTNDFFFCQQCISF